MSKTQQPELPALPTCQPYVEAWVKKADDWRMEGRLEPANVAYYTADQMRAYAQAAVLADRERRDLVLRSIAGYPIAEQDNMSAANMRQLAQWGLETPGAGEGDSAGAGGGPMKTEIAPKSLSDNALPVGRAGADRAAGAGAVVCSFCGTCSTDMPNNMRVIASYHGAMCEGCHDIAGRVFKNAAPSKVEDSHG